MFGLYFGHYLVERRVLSKPDAAAIEDLGYPDFIDALVEKNYCTKDEAEKHLQNYKADHALDDEAVGILSAGRLEDIVPLFIKFDASRAVRDNIEAFKKDAGLTDDEAEKLEQDGELRWAIPDFVQKDPLFHSQFIFMAVENFSRLISKKFVMRRARMVETYHFGGLAYQALKGAHRTFLGISGNHDSLRTVAGVFVKREFPELNNLAFDSLCELINSVNGVFASRLSTAGVFMEIDLPHWYADKSIVSNGTLYCLPIAMEGAEIELIFSFDSEMKIL